MKEIEAKFKIENLNEIKNKLKQLNTTLKGKNKQIDIYFKHPKKESLKDVPTYLRIRTTNNKSSIAMHSKVGEYEWEELETEIKNPEIIKKIYLNLGFNIDVEVNKERETYQIPEGEIVLDIVKNRGFY